MKKKRLRADARSRKRRKPASDAGTNDKEWTAEPCPNTILSRKGTIISYLIAFERLFRTKQTKKEPACSVVEQAGVPIDRVIGGLRERILIAHVWSMHRPYGTKIRLQNARTRDTMDTYRQCRCPNSVRT